MFAQSETPRQGWLQRPRSMTWKLTASVIWVVLTVAAFMTASVVFVDMATANQPAVVQLRASQEMGSAMVLPMLMVAVAGIFFVARRPAA